MTSEQYFNLISFGTLETLYMVGVSTLVAYIFGLPLGMLASLTNKNGLCPNKIVNAICEVVVNLGRSIPFIILLVAIIPFTRLIVGTSIGTTAVIVPLSVAAIPFVARVVDTSVKELDNGIVEASLSMGATKWQIVWHVILREILPSLIRGVALTAICLVGYSAMAGTVGGGGLGKLAIDYGYSRYDTKMMLYTCVILVILVQLIQWIFNGIAKKIDKKNI